MLDEKVACVIISPNLYMYVAVLHIFLCNTYVSVTCSSTFIWGISIMESVLL